MLIRRPVKLNLAVGDLRNMNIKKEDDIKKLVRLIDPTNKGVELLRKLFVDVTRTEIGEWDRLLEEIGFNIVVSLYYPIYKYFYGCYSILLRGLALFIIIYTIIFYKSGISLFVLF